MSTTVQRWTIEEIRAANEAAGLRFFEEGALRFFRSRILRKVFQGPGGVFFVTSEQFAGSDGRAAARRFTVRTFDPETGRVGDASDFQRFARAGIANQTAARLAAGK